jgi:hypothetical protein
MQAASSAADCQDFFYMPNTLYDLWKYSSWGIAMFINTTLGRSFLASTTA